MASDAEKPSRRVRVSRACQFCKVRKLKCDNGYPLCSNCSAYGRECIYQERSKRARPTNAIITSLREENKTLRSRLSAEPSTANESTGSRHDENSAALITNTALLTPAVPQSQSRAPASLSDNATYHGPTSTLYDDAPATRPPLQQWFSADRESRMPTLLFAEAAKQRQLEAVNSARGLLDFDGLDPEMGLHLLNLHWNRQHHSFLVTYRPAFMRDMACNGPYFSKILLNAIYFGSSKFSPRLELRTDPNDVRTAGAKFRQRVRDLLGEAMDQSKITTIQALLQMTNSLFALGDEQSAAWLYAGLAFRMIIDLGLHLDATLMSNIRNISDEDLEIRRRVFWSAFVIDKIQSLYQGRPAALQASECDVPIVFKDEYEELEHWTPFAYTGRSSYSGSCSYSVSTFAQLCRLCIILNQILNKVYREKRAAESPHALRDDLASLEQELVQWFDQLPTHLSLSLDREHATDSIPPPHVLSLLAIANVLRILLHRPFVSDGHLHSKSPSVAVGSFKQCATAATNIVKLVRMYDGAFSVSRAPYLISYATYVAATIQARIASKRGASSEAHACLRTCLSVLRHNSETNYAVRKAIYVVESLMTTLGVKAPEKQQDKVVRTSSSPHDHTHHTLTDLGVSPSQSIEWEPTFVAGNMAPDLDVDAIIRSFIQEQEISGPSAIAEGNQTLYTGTGELRFEDMIFGFNAADFDAMV